MQLGEANTRPRITLLWLPAVIITGNTAELEIYSIRPKQSYGKNQRRNHACNTFTAGRKVNVSHNALNQQGMSIKNKFLFTMTYNTGQTAMPYGTPNHGRL
jgi:hypothetical protein